MSLTYNSSPTPVNKAPKRSHKQNPRVATLISGLFLQKSTPKKNARIMTPVTTAKKIDRLVSHASTLISITSEGDYGARSIPR